MSENDDVESSQTPRGLRLNKKQRRQPPSKTRPPARGVRGVIANPASPTTRPQDPGTAGRDDFAQGSEPRPTPRFTIYGAGLPPGRSAEDAGRQGSRASRAKARIDLTPRRRQPTDTRHPDRGPHAPRARHPRPEPRPGQVRAPWGSGFAHRGVRHCVARVRERLLTSHQCRVYTHRAGLRFGRKLA